MNQLQFNRIVTRLSSDLLTIKDYGQVITNEYIENRVDETLKELKQKIPGFEYVDTDISRLKFDLRNMFNVSVDEEMIVLSNPDAIRWFDNKKSTINWKHWNSYKEMLLSQARAIDTVEKNEEVIDAILDYSSDPTLPGPWARKGLVMGNVQSGKTQNYLGLINKAIDCGYKVVILLGGHLVDLRKQTQERVDEGILGRESRHLIQANIAKSAPIGVGLYGSNNVDTGTTTLADFNRPNAESLGRNLNGNNDPFIFTIKKHPGVMKNLYEWIRDYHYLDPENGKKMNVPLLLIDDEADYASINTKHHIEEVTATNAEIRKLLSLFHRNTYVGYTATPFANIFIDPDDSSYSDEDDLFPSDFMIKLPTPNNYMGQDFFFNSDEIDETISPCVIIDDYEPIYELKKQDEITIIPESLKEAVRAFVLVIAIRSIRGEWTSHNTMLVNISHLKIHQDRLEFLIEQYRKTIYESLSSFSSLGVEAARKNPTVMSLEETFKNTFSVEETFNDIFVKLTDSVGKVKVWAINQSKKSAHNRTLDYSSHKEFGLNVIVIGGHKLSRGLTLEGLSVSYFARNSKAYDTLMQMCRWFGYRPTYKDLCKLYLPVESLDWYTFIAGAIKELYGELDLMSKSEKRPKDFGLKVREHPGAMIVTSKNKIGFSESEVRSQSLWGQVQRRFSFYSSKEINENNLKYAERFINSISDKCSNQQSPTKDDLGPIIFTNIEYSKLIDFIRNVNLPQDDVGNDALIHHLEGMQKAGLPNPKVALFNQSSSSKTQWEDGLSQEDKDFINGKITFCSRNIVMPKRAMRFDGTLYQIPSVNLGNSDDEKIFLSSSAITKVKSLKQDSKPVSFDYIASEERDYPGLIIYLFAVAYKQPWGKPINNQEQVVRLGHGHMPTLGYSISLPRTEEIKNKTQAEIKEIINNTKHSYLLNKVQKRLKSLLDYTENYEYDE